MCEAIYIGNNKHTFKKRMDGRFFDILCPIENGKIIFIFCPCKTAL